MSTSTSPILKFLKKTLKRYLKRSSWKKLKRKLNLKVNSRMMLRKKNDLGVIRHKLLIKTLPKKSNSTSRKGKTKSKSEKISSKPLKFNLLKMVLLRRMVRELINREHLKRQTKTNRIIKTSIDLKKTSNHKDLIHQKELMRKIKRCNINRRRSKKEKVQLKATLQNINQNICPKF